MRMTINRLRIENFKGIRHFEMDFPDGNLRIAGQNGTGKTSIVDAFCWVLWNQDSHGNAPGSDNFREKPLDENGQTLHNLETTVELCCTLDGQQRFDLKRTQTENWVKKRGSAEPTFQGNVSTYWINDVETKQADFKARVQSIADSEISRLVGGLSAFNNLEWRRRRNQLFRLAGDDADSALLAMDEYRPIFDEITQRGITFDDLRKVVADRRKVINKTLKELPVRIDEQRNSMPQFKPHELEDATYIIDTTKKDIETIEQQIADAKAQTGGGYSQSAMTALKSEIVSIRRRLDDEHASSLAKLKAAADTANANFRNLSGMIAEARLDAENVDARLASAVKQVDALRQQYMDVKRKPADMVFETCPTCGQPLPAEKIEEAKRSAEINRRNQLQNIQQRGKQAAAEVERIGKARQEAAQKVSELEDRLRAAQTARETSAAELAGFPAQPDYAADSRLQDAQAQLEAMIAEQAADPDEKVAQLIERKREMLAIVDTNLKILARQDDMIARRKVIEEYEADQKRYGDELSETDVMLDLMDRYARARCAALENSVNAQFPTVRWKLFDEQINGGIVETCQCMIQCGDALVPYESANTASQIAADVEIVDVLSRHYDIRMPLFVDNAERVNALPRIDSQTITLSVSTDSELNIKEAQ